MTSPEFSTSTVRLFQPEIIAAEPGGLKDERGQRVLWLIANVSDLRPGSQWYISAPALLSPERIAKLLVVPTLHVLDCGARTSYAVQDGTVGDCLAGNDRGEYREAAQKFINGWKL